MFEWKCQEEKESAQLRVFSFSSRRSAVDQVEANGLVEWWSCVAEHQTRKEQKEEQKEEEEHMRTVLHSLVAGILFDRPFILHADESERVLIMCGVSLMLQELGCPLPSRLLFSCEASAVPNHLVQSVSGGVPLFLLRNINLWFQRRKSDNQLLFGCPVTLLSTSEQTETEEWRRFHPAIDVNTSSTLENLLTEELQTNQIAAQRVFARINQATASYPQDRVLHDLFAKQVQQTPNRIAVVFGTQKLTFQQLDQYSTLLACFLYAKGIRPNKITGLFMDHCVEFVIGYLAALKAGGAYMPLELVYPPELLSRVLEESEPIVVLTKEKYANRIIQKDNKVVVFSMDIFNPNDFSNHSIANDGKNEYYWVQQLELEHKLSLKTCNLPEDRCLAKPDDLAYVVMSSGTTGVPKGICCPHRGAVHSYDWRLKAHPFDEEGEREERVACHVFFVWELMRPLIGGKNSVLYIIPDDVIYDPIALLTYLVSNKITRVLFTPSLLQLILDSIEESQATLINQLKDSLHLIWLCGEVVTSDLRSRLMSLLPNVKLLNLYSVSECHDVSAVDLSATNTSSSQLNLHYSPKFASCGPLLPNVRAFLLDENSQLIRSFGVPGELYIGGPTLAIGYLNRPEQTKERFPLFSKEFLGIDDDSNTNQIRLYKTGDRGRILPNGQLELIGRCDFMVKIRGFSVVLGAVEAAIAKHSKVSTAVVIVEGEEGEEKRLVAYVVPESWSVAPETSELRQYLKSELPPYAIPSLFIQLDALPIHAASGKLDRKKLPPIESARKKRSDSMERQDIIIKEKWTLIEEKLVSIWSNLLRLPSSKIRREDSFFDIGGHSLLATRLVAAINEEITLGEKEKKKVKISLSDVIRHAELSAMALAIEKPFLSHTKPESVDHGCKIDLPCETILDGAIYPAATRKSGYSRFRMEMMSRQPRHVFITGVTGFLGSHLLACLLEDCPSLLIFCLIRASDEQKGMQRIETTLKTYGLLKSFHHTEEWDHLMDRVVVVCGDLSKPLLGLDKSTFTMLASEVDSIIHNGADVNLVKPYASLKNVNVLGTQEVLRLAVTNAMSKTRVKPVFYISTNGVFPTNSNLTDLTLFENADLSDNWQQLSDGYGQSKWVAEQLCREASSRGLPVSILRPGNMAPSTESGIWNRSDFIHLLLHACVKTRSFPQVNNWFFDMTPVNFAARAIVEMAVFQPRDALGQTFHIQNPQKPLPSQQFFSFLPKNYKPLPLDQWQQQLNLFDDEKISLLQSGFDSFLVYLTNHAVFDATATTKLLKPDLQCPEIDNRIVATYLSTL